MLVLWTGLGGEVEEVKLFRPGSEKLRRWAGLGHRTCHMLLDLLSINLALGLLFICETEISAWICITTAVYLN